MSRRKRKYESNIPPEEKAIQGLKYTDLKRQCLIRGMPFEEAVKGDFHSLSTFFRKNFDEVPNPELLNKYDEWFKKLMEEKYGADSKEVRVLTHPQSRMGFIAQKDEEGNVIKKKRVRGISSKKKRKKRKRNNKFGIFSGTKKELTYRCEAEGKSLAETTKEVLDTFPEAKENSIKIWYRRAKKSRNG